MLPDDGHQIMLDCFFRVIEYIFILTAKYDICGLQKLLHDLHQFTD